MATPGPKPTSRTLSSGNVEQLDHLRGGIPVHARHDHPAQPSQDPPGVTEHAHQELAPASHGFDFRRNNRSRKAPGLLDTYDRSASFVSGPWRVPNVHDKTA